MATLISSLITNVRTTPLIEPTANFWSDAELLDHAVNGIRDLWKAILDLNEGHFVTIDETNVSMAASSNTLTGVPADVFRVELIELRDQTSASSIQDLTFEPRAINHPDFTGARSLGTVDPGGTTVYFSVFGAGVPVGTPSIEVAPKINTAALLRLVYTAGIGTLTAGSTNPIPGESDHAIQAWIVAHARAKEREDRSPDPEWMAIYATDKAKILTALTPRQTQEPEVAEAMFEAYWG
jgi:hypothetical protein